MRRSFRIIRNRSVDRSVHASGNPEGERYSSLLSKRWRVAECMTSLQEGFTDIR